MRHEALNRTPVGTSLAGDGEERAVVVHPVACFLANVVFDADATQSLPLVHEHIVLCRAVPAKKQKEFIRFRLMG